MTGVVAYLLFVGMLVAAAARGIDESLRLAGLPTRWTWAGGLLVLAALALWAPAGTSVLAESGSMPAARQVAAEGLAAPQQDGSSALAIQLARLWDVTSEVPGRIIGTIGDALPAGAQATFGLVWASMSLVLMVVLITVYVRFRRAVDRFPVVTVGGEAVRLSPDAGPAVVGLTRPAIVVPRWLLDTTAAEQQLVVAHEREHLAARDPHLLMGGCFVVALLPWHPAAWWMLARLRLAVEMDCDARVLARGIPRRLYGATLIDVAARCARLPLGVPALADHTTNLERRLIAMTPGPIAFRRTRAAAVGLAAALTLAAACEARLPTTPEIEGMDVTAAERHAVTQFALRSDTLLAYYVDGKVVTAAASRALPANEISSIEVSRSRIHGDTASLRITTRSAAALAARTDSGSFEYRAAKRKPFLRSDAADGKAPVVVARSGEAFAGLVIIDGIKSNAAALAGLAPARIQSMEVLKGAAATKLYDEPEAAKGVIRVMTRGG